METEKIKVSVNQGLPMIAEMIKFKYVTDYIGKSSSWIYHKMNHETTTTTSKGFSQSDIDLLNTVFKELNIIFFRQRFRCNIQEFCRTIENIILHLLNSRLIQ